MTAGCIMTGTKMSASRPTSRPKKSRGVTPMIVNGVPDSEIVRPSAVASAPNRRFQ